MRLSPLLVPLLLGACATTPVAPMAPAAAPTSLVVSTLGEDASGLADAADRLCGYLAPAPRRALGFELALRARTQAPRDKATALTAARCAYFRADWEPNPKQMAAFARAGMDAAKAAGAKDGDPRAAYYYALNLGLTMRDAGLEALSLIPEEIAALETARKDAGQDLGGPLRVLGMLYLKAPAWPAGPGDLDLALELLEEATTRFPSHPLNRVFYADALKEEKETKAVSAQLDAALLLASPELWGDYAERWRAEAAALR